ncbi:MAG: nicotinic acid mononucleotide adenylyltransferase, partial [Candidatus Omnitrophica bacterium]|nr:nicotinic acid mononucleotide adenylyltransferase [Candidatus Omnitrophota bacterium]
YEIDSKDISYTINTVEYFKQRSGNDELYFLAGADWAGTITEWKNIEKILELVNFVIVTRSGWKEKCEVKDEIQFVEIPAIDISSTEIRERIAECRPIDHLVPGSVVRVIRDKGLYK